MSEAEELRQRAENLLAMALKAREQGQFAYADSLIEEASHFINDAEALETSAKEAEQPARPPRKQ